MKINAFFFGLIACILAFFCPAPAARATITIDSASIYTSNRGGDGSGVLDMGYLNILECNVSPSGSGTTVTAQQVSGGSNTATLAYYSSPPFPNVYADIKTFDAGLTGQWQITAVNGGESATKLSTVLDDIRQLPLAQSVSASTVTGTLTPTVSWTGFDPALYPVFSGTPVNGSDSFYVRVRVRSASTGRVAWDSGGNMPTSVTSYTLPAGALEPGQDYLLAVVFSHHDYESGAWPLENRSETFLAYSTPPLAINSQYVYTLNRGGEAHAADYIMDIGAKVNATEGNTITSVWAYNGSNNYQLSFLDFGAVGAYYQATVPYTGQTGIWEIRATDNLGETASAYTHNLDKPLQIPLATGVSFSDQTTSPTISWNLVPSSAVDGYRVRVTTNGWYALYRSALQQTSGFKIPAGIMTVGNTYIIRLEAEDYDYENSVLVLENRSSYYAYFTPTSAASIPGDFYGDCDVDGSDVAALIANSSWLDPATFAQNFGKNACQ